MTKQEEKDLEKWMKDNYIEFLQATARNIKKHCHNNTYCEDCSFFDYYKQRCKLNDIPKNWEV